MELNSFRRVYSSEDNEYLLQNISLSPNTHTHTHTHTHNGKESGTHGIKLWLNHFSLSLLFSKTEIISIGQDCHEDQNYHKYLVVLLIHCSYNYVNERFENFNLIFMLFIPSKLYF